ncbi:hypothetical protein CK203_051556 [Vitis vinifera]|uniref:Reverse transcriptase domain-containing protein n=1 Tax=Vitis vinifera TaxID=29760 RepID=A0A438GXI3_VITVI|nr:hypothetical protein CK203_051556 [Vitis vinifera]
MIRSQKVDLFCIQETKIQSMTEGLVRSLASGRLLDWGAMGAQGAAGGILICWDKRTLEVLEMEMGQFSISCRLRNVEDGNAWIFPRVYGSFSKEDRGILWEELRAIRGIWDDPWCLGGNFNVTLSQREMSNQGRLIGAMRRFAQVVDELELLDLPMQEGVFSWSGGVGGRGRANFRLATKMKVLKEKIKGWNMDVFRRLEVNKNSTLQQVEFLDGVESERSLIEDETELKREVKETFKNGCFWKKLTGDKFLIPKKGGADDLGDFRPISLLGGLYKLLAKVLANRLKKVLDKVVSTDQNAFVRGRQILDASLIANKVLYKMGFGARWMEWIWWCISTAKFSVLVNGVPAGYFSNSRGLRQGDPSFLTFLCWGGMEMNVSHLLFADDTIIFYEARQDHLTSLSWILAWFEAASGLKIHLAKSEVIPVGEVEDIDELAVELGCRMGSLPTVYLGLPLGANHKASSMWDGVEERMRRSGGLEGDFEGDEWVLDNIGFKVGEGTKVNFCTDQWCGNEALSQTFPQLFALAVQRNATVNEMWDSSFGQGGWNIRLSRYSNDWELEAIRELFHMLRDLRISSEEDSVIWKGGGHSSFRIRDAYKLLAAPSAITFPKRAFGWISGQDPLGDCPCLVWGSLGVPRDSQRGVT